MPTPIFVIIGPSGAGKDSVLRVVKEKMPDLHIPKRVITRAEHAESESFESVTKAEFLDQLNHKEFLFHWHAHDLYYGIRSADVLPYLEIGAAVMINGSRAALDKMRNHYPSIHPIGLSVAPATLKQRLELRGRENMEQIATRLERAARPMPTNCHIISNDGRLDETAKKVVAFISQIRGYGR